MADRFVLFAPGVAECVSVFMEERPLPPIQMRNALAAALICPASTDRTKKKSSRRQKNKPLARARRPQPTNQRMQHPLITRPPARPAVAPSAAAAAKATPSSAKQPHRHERRCRLRRVQ